MAGRGCGGCYAFLDDGNDPCPTCGWPDKVPVVATKPTERELWSEWYRATIKPGMHIGAAARLTLEYFAERILLLMEKLEKKI